MRRLKTSMIRVVLSLSCVKLAFLDLSPGPVGCELTTVSLLPFWLVTLLSAIKSHFLLLKKDSCVTQLV